MKRNVSEHSDSESLSQHQAEQQELIATEQPVFGFKKFGLKLATGFTSFHAAMYVLGVFLTISIFVFLNSTQGFVLKDVLKVPTSELGNTSGNLVFYDQLASLLVIAGWGTLSDLIGKYLVFGMGFTIMALALGLFTFAASVYPELLLYRILYSIGGAACSAMLTGILADIAFEQDRSKFAGVVGLASGFGALLGVFVFLPLPTRFGDAVQGLQTTYLLVGGVSILAAILMYTTWISLVRRRLFSRQNGPNEQPQASPQSRLEQFCSNFKQGFLAAKNPNIFLGYAGNFLARSDSVSITLFLPLWVYRFYLDNNLCGNFDISDPGLGKESCRDAYIRASILSGVTQVFALVGAPIFGKNMIDRVSWRQTV